MVKNLIAVCNRGGFNLTKWIGNSQEELHSIAEEYKSKNLYELVLDRDCLPIEMALGLQWCIETDTLVKVKEQPHTKCGMLSTTSSIHNLLELLAAFKLLLQELCQKKMT